MIPFPSVVVKSQVDLLLSYAFILVWLYSNEYAPLKTKGEQTKPYVCFRNTK